MDASYGNVCYVNELEKNEERVGQIHQGPGSPQWVNRALQTEVDVHNQKLHAQVAALPLELKEARCKAITLSEERTFLRPSQTTSTT